MCPLLIIDCSAVAALDIFEVQHRLSRCFSQVPKGTGMAGMNAIILRGSRQHHGWVGPFGVKKVNRAEGANELPLLRIFRVPVFGDPRMPS